MRGLSSILAAAFTLVSGCATETFPSAQGVSVTINRKEPAKRLANPSKAAAEEGTSDPCAMLIQDPTLEMYYKKWRAHFDEVMGDGEATPIKTHDHDWGTDACYMWISNIYGKTTSVNIDIRRDGQFAGSKVNEKKPNISFRVALETGHEPLDENTSRVPESPFQGDNASTCESLTIDQWKVWDPKMPGSTKPQLVRNEIALPCDPTATAYISSGGCWSDEVTGEDGCGGSSTEVDRKEVQAVITCMRKIVTMEGIKLCL